MGRLSISRHSKSICIVSSPNIQGAEKADLEDFITKLEKEGFTIFYQPRDINPLSNDYYKLLDDIRTEMRFADEVMAYYTKEGSHYIDVCIGMAFDYNKPINIININKTGMEGMIKDLLVDLHCNYVGRKANNQTD